MKRTILPIILMGLLAGCIHEIKLDLPSDPPRIIVDALISNEEGESYVEIGWSTPVNSSCADSFGYPVACEPETNDGPYKINGTIRIIEKDSNTVLELPLRMKDKEGVIRLSPDIEGTAGNTYELEILFDYNGTQEFYSATSLMRATPLITDIAYEIRQGDVGKPDSMVPLVSFSEPAGKNFYLFHLCSGTTDSFYCGSSRAWAYSLISDTFLPANVRGLSIDDGATVAKYADFYPPPEGGATLTVWMYSVDDTTYDFYKSLIGQFDNDGGAYSPTPASPGGNISGGAIGLFRALDASAATVYY